MMYHFEPLQDFYKPLPPDLTPRERDEILRQSLRAAVRSVIAFFLLIIAGALCSLFTSCTTQKVVASQQTEHYVSDMMQRMDSLMHSRTVVQQDSVWRETILRQFQSIREKSDTSHHVVVDSAGRVIQEKIVINNVREVTSETDRQEIHRLSHQVETMDSTMRIIQQQIQHSDSLLQQRQQIVEKEVPAQLSWWQQTQIWMGRLVLVALAVLLAVWLVRKRTWWLSLLRKII